MRQTGTCWYDGHRCTIEMVGRERYEARFNGEEFDQSGYPSSMRDDMITEAKYRTEREPDFVRVCHEVFRFLDAHVPGRNGENEWVLFDAVKEEVVLNDHALALEAMHTLEHDDYIDITKAYDPSNYQYLLAPKTESIPEPEQLRGSLTKIWNEYE